MINVGTGMTDVSIPGLADPQQMVAKRMRCVRESVEQHDEAAMPAGIASSESRERQAVGLERERFEFGHQPNLPPESAARRPPPLDDAAGSPNSA